MDIRNGEAESNYSMEELEREERKEEDRNLKKQASLSLVGQSRSMTDPGPYHLSLDNADTRVKISLILSPAQLSQMYFVSIIPWFPRPQYPVSNVEP